MRELETNPLIILKLKELSALSTINVGRLGAYGIEAIVKPTDGIR